MNQAILSIIIIVIAVISFAMEKIPLAVTALLASLAMGVFGIMPITQIYAGFASTTFIMVMGMMIVGDCLFESGLAKLVGQRLVKSKLGSNERVLIIVMMAFAGVLSAFLSNSAVVATCIPLVGSMVAKSRGKLQNKNIIMGIGMAAALGGCGTIVGSTSQLTAQGILQGTEGAREMGFFELGYVVFPLLAVLILYFATFGYKIGKKKFDFQDVSVIGEAAVTSDEEEEIKLTFHMAVSGVVIVLCVIGFIVKIWNVATIALLGATICLATGCKPFKKAMSGLDWNTLVILAAAQGFAKGLDVSGGGKLIADFAINICGGVNAQPIILLIVGIVVSVVLTNFMSNTAVAAMLTPIFISIGFQLGVEPTIFVLGSVIGGSTALATPIGTPAVTQTLVAGYRYKDYVIVGLPITIILTILTCILCPIMYSFVPL